MMNFIIFFILFPVINEVMNNVRGSDSQTDGTPGDRNEFIEIYNTGNDTIYLSGWTFTDMDAIDNILPWTDSTILTYYPGVIINDTLLYPGQYAIILDPEYLEPGNNQYNRPYAFIEGTLILTVGNTTLGDGLSTTDPIILFSPEGDTVSSYGTTFTPFDPGDGISIERIDPLAPDSISNWIRSQDTSGSTPGRANSLKPYPDLAIFSSGIEITPSFPDTMKPFSVVSKFYNIGQKALDSIKIQLFIGGTLSDSFKFPGILNPFDSSVVEFTVDSLFYPLLYTLTIKGFSPFDSNPSNNSANIKVWVGIKPVFITEIMFKSECEWFEIYNFYKDTLSFKNYKISDANKSSKYTLPDFSLPSFEYAVIVKDSSCFYQKFGALGNIKYIKPFAGFPALNNTGDVIFLYDSINTVMDSVPYSPDWGGDYDISLEKKILGGSSVDPLNWGTCLDPIGATPGFANSYLTIPIEKGEYLKLSDKIFTPDGDGKNDILYIYINSPFQNGEIYLYIFDSAGYLKQKILDKAPISSKTVLSFPKDLKEELTGGLYILYLEIRDKTGGGIVFDKKTFAIWKK